MKKTILAFLAVTLCGTAFPVLAADKAPSYDSIKSHESGTEFTQSIEDLPVMPGLEVANDKDVFILFGNQRIAQTTLKGQVDIDEVYYFYGNVLPELGWKKVDSKTYQRDGETLRMTPSSANRKGMTFVRFEVEPTAK